MKRFIIVCCLIFALGGLVTLAFANGILYLPGSKDRPPEGNFKQEGTAILARSQDAESGWEAFQVRGVDLGSSIPGHFATDYAIDEETYLRWFDQVKAMGANTVRVWTLQGAPFYKAVKTYNESHPQDPLYVLQGIWVDDYAQDSHADAFDDSVLGRLKDDIRTAIDVVHGQRPLELGRLAATGSYTSDISPWLLGYAIGAEWEGRTVVYTDKASTDRSSFQGEFLATAEGSTPFEAMLAEAGNMALEYETTRYREQHLLGLSCTSGMDPFSYPAELCIAMESYATVDLNRIVPTEKVSSGIFASYHIDASQADLAVPWLESGTVSLSPQERGYGRYLQKLCEHHTLPVVVANMGASSSRGCTQADEEGSALSFSEEEQAAELVSLWRDAYAAGCPGGSIYSWQDEWFKSSWNTREYIDLLKTPFWHDRQSEGQSFGLLAFDPGAKRSTCYVDGDCEEWSKSHALGSRNGLEVHLKYDEESVYLMVRGQGVSPDSPLYLPVDTTPKSGSKACQGPALSFDRAADFVIAIDNGESGRVLVQARNDALRATSLMELTGEDPFVAPPAADSASFSIEGMLARGGSSQDAASEAAGGAVADGAAQGDAADAEAGDGTQARSNSLESGLTGYLVAGNANPASSSYNSLADYCYGDGFVEIRIPWQLLGFSNPSQMMVHDDCYERYGIDPLAIEGIFVGAGDGSSEIGLFEAPLEGWGENVAYHERLKTAYYAMQQVWTSEDPAGTCDALLAEGGMAQAAAAAAENAVR